jgi:5-methylcytosine-specific restriction endonuclease McrA
MRAMRALVAALKKRKYATLESSPERACEPKTSPARGCDPKTADTPPRAASTTSREGADALEQDADQPHTHALEQDADQRYTRRRGRHIPAAVRRSVFERDGSRCSYLDANGTRCPETHRLEFHHLNPFATGGDHCASNLTLRCAAHNALAAEEDFGRELMEDRKASIPHEPFGSFTR